MTNKQRLTTTNQVTTWGRCYGQWTCSRMAPIHSQKAMVIRSPRVMRVRSVLIVIFGKRRPCPRQCHYAVMRHHRPISLNKWPESTVLSDSTTHTLCLIFSDGVNGEAGGSRRVQMAGSFRFIADLYNFPSSLDKEMY